MAATRTLIRGGGCIFMHTGALISYCMDLFMTILPEQDTRMSELCSSDLKISID